VKPAQDDVERAAVMPMTYYAGESGDGIRTLREIKEAIAQALADAREREMEACARLADKAMLVPPDGGAPTTDEVNMCECIAAAIRSRGAEKEE